jgi:hypothetical protein
VDVPRKILEWVLSGKSKLNETMLEKNSIQNKIRFINNKNMQNACKSMCKYADEILSPTKKAHKFYLAFTNTMKDIGRECGYVS